MVHWGVGLPAHLPEATRSDILGYARRSEELGFDSLWVGDRIVFGNLDPLPTLAAAAAVTERVELAPTTFIGPARAPIEVAKAFATIDVLSAGRVRAVLSVGHRADDYEATDHAFARRGDRLDELLEVVKLVWSGGPVRYDGAHYQYDLAPIGPRPVRESGIPLWVAGDSDRARRRAVRLGAGHMSGTAGRDKTARLRGDFDRLCEERGRAPATLAVGATAYFALGFDPREALARGMSELLPYYGTLHWDPVTDVIWGSPSEAAARVVAYGASSLETFVFIPSSLGLDQLDRLREVVDLAEELLLGQP